MSILNEVQAEAARRRAQRRSCAFRAYFQGLPVADRNELRKAIVDPTVPASALFSVLRDQHGFLLGRTTIKQHRRRECTTCLADPKGVYGKAERA